MQMIKSFTRSILKELKFRKFGFRYNHLEQFYQSQWQRGERSGYYLIYRWIWALCFSGVFIACLALQFSDGKLFIFLTNWGILLCLATQLIAAVLVTRWHFNLGSVRAAITVTPTGRKHNVHHRDDDDDNDYEINGSKSTPLILQFYWLLHGVALTLALVITTIYWTFLHGKMNKPMRFPMISFITHCLNSVFMLVDFWIIAFPVRILHSVYWMLCPIIYCFFTVGYFLAGGVDEYGNHYVYPILDWTTPVRGITTFAGVFCLYLIYTIIIFSIHKFKRFLARTLKAMGSPHVVGLI